MARLARIVVPGVAHHVTQRGNRRQEIFFSEHDYAAYRALVAEACARTGQRCLAWCLMPNHVHLILVPGDVGGLRAALAEAHRRYSRRINAMKGWTGYLFQGRFASYPMDDAHLMVAVRYVELNPVWAGLVARAEDWPWSSARSHVTGTPDGLTDPKGLAGIHRNWRAMLRLGLESGDLSAEAIAAIVSDQSSVRPWGDEPFIERLEELPGRRLKRQNAGTRPKS